MFRSEKMLSLKKQASVKRERLSLERDNPISKAAAAAVARQTQKQSKRKKEPSRPKVARRSVSADSVVVIPPRRTGSGQSSTGSIDLSSGNKGGSKPRKPRRTKSTEREPPKSSSPRKASLSHQEYQTRPKRRTSDPVPRRRTSEPVLQPNAGSSAALISEDDITEISTTSSHSTSGLLLVPNSDEPSRDQLRNEFYVAAAKLVIQSWHDFYTQDGFEEEWGELILQHMQTADPTARQRLGLLNDHNNSNDSGLLEDDGEDDDTNQERLSDLCNLLVEMVDIIVTCFSADLKEFATEIQQLGEQCRKEGIPTELLQDALLFALEQMGGSQMMHGFDALTKHAWMTVLSAVIPKMSCSGDAGALPTPTTLGRSATTGSIVL
mmetsp:Transcript_10715/g.25721  ORF Transcript_10715/g.25721 Transcript_10715/m.25721 type:complete len:380 (+) Transcript_10715:113-1252(+)